MVGVTALESSSIKHQLVNTDFSSTIKATTFDSSPRPCCAQLTSAPAPMFWRPSPSAAFLISGSASRFSSPEHSASCNQAQLSTATYKCTWQMKTRVSGSCIQKWGLPLYSSNVTRDFYFTAWAKTIVPYQKARISPRSNLGQVCHFMLCCCTEKSITTC